MILVVVETTLRRLRHNRVELLLAFVVPVLFFSIFALIFSRGIGGTPSVLVGAGHVCRNTKRDTVLRAIMTDQMRRSVLAFPDEDVLIGAQLNDAGAFEAFKSLDDIVPRPDHKASGEERAWGRRLAKRFGIGASVYEDRVFIARGDGSQAPVLDHESSKPEKTDPEVIALFGDVDIANGDTLIGFGWAMAEDLEKLL